MYEGTYMSTCFWSRFKQKKLTKYFLVIKYFWDVVRARISKILMETRYHEDWSMTIRYYAVSKYCGNVVCAFRMHHQQRSTTPRSNSDYFSIGQSAGYGRKSGNFCRRLRRNFFTFIVPVNVNIYYDVGRLSSKSK